MAVNKPQGGARGERRDAVTVVYLDAYLILNLVGNYVLLVCAGRLDGDLVSRLRCLGAAALGAGYGCLSLLPAGAFLSHPVGQAAAGVAMLLVAYGRSDRLLRTGGLFLVLSCAWGGGLLLLSAARGGWALGVPGAGLGMRGILIAAALCYGGLSLALQGQFAHTRTGGELETLTLTHQGKTLTLLALRDTGHTLSDPLTGRPVVVVEGAKLKSLLPRLPLDSGDLARPVELLRQVKDQAPELGLQLLPYRAVGVDCGLLLALRLDRAEWGGKTYPNCLAALSPTPVSDGGGYCALVGVRDG